MNVPDRVFQYETTYTREEIEAQAGEVEEWEDEGRTYLIAQADVEYWFLPDPEGPGWVVDHTWGSFILANIADE